MSNHGIKDLKTISFKFSCIVCIFLGIWAIHYKNNCLVLRKSACPFGQVKTKMFTCRGKRASTYVDARLWFTVRLTA